MVAAKVIERDRGWAKIVKGAQELKRAHVKVGVLEASGEEKGSGQTVAEIASIHEYGAPDAGIPERSFIRSTLAEQQPRLRELGKQLARKALVEQSITVRQALGIIGETVKLEIQRKIVSGPFAPNAASTIKAKGSSSPLIDTGQLRQSITYQVVDGAAPKIPEGVR